MNKSHFICRESSSIIFPVSYLSLSLWWFRVQLEQRDQPAQPSILSLRGVTPWTWRASWILLSCSIQILQNRFQIQAVESCSFVFPSWWNFIVIMNKKDTSIAVPKACWNLLIVSHHILQLDYFKHLLSKKPVWNKLNGVCVAAAWWDIFSIFNLRRRFF